MRVMEQVRRGGASPDFPRSRVGNWLVAGILLVAVVAATLAIATRERASDPVALSTTLGRPAPVVLLPQESNGKRAAQLARIGGKAGHPQLLVFFFTLCAHCLGEVSTIQANAAAHAFGDTAVTYIDSPGERSDITDAYATREGISAPVLLDPDSSAAHAYHVSYFPSVVLIDSQGIVRGAWYGAVPLVTLQHAVAALASHPAAG